MAARRAAGAAPAARFAGFPAAALSFYEGLVADNSKSYWTANKAVYDAAVRAPLEALLAELEPEFGHFHTFRPNRDVRFSSDKAPYKTHTGSVTEAQGGTMYYLQLSATGLLAGAGYYAMAGDQLARFRAAVDGEHTGSEIASIVADLERRGYTMGAVSEVKTAPRGIRADHPRIALLRRKGLIASRNWGPEPWLATKTAKTRIATAFRGAAPLTEWLDTHVGPSELPPDDAVRW